MCFGKTNYGIQYSLKCWHCYTNNVNYFLVVSDVTGGRVNKHNFTVVHMQRHVFMLTDFFVSDVIHHQLIIIV
jgi:hypothetical protein